MGFLGGQLLTFIHSCFEKRHGLEHVSRCLDHAVLDFGAWCSRAGRVSCSFFIKGQGARSKDEWLRFWLVSDLAGSEAAPLITAGLPIFRRHFTSQNNEFGQVQSCLKLGGGRGVDWFLPCLYVLPPFHNSSIVASSGAKFTGLKSRITTCCIRLLISSIPTCLF